MVDTRWQIIPDLSLIISDFIMISLLLLKVINVLAHFLIFLDTGLCKYFSLREENCRNLAFPNIFNNMTSK